MSYKSRRPELPFTNASKGFVTGGTQHPITRGEQDFLRAQNLTSSQTAAIATSMSKGPKL